MTPAPDPAEARLKAERARRRARVFGEVLPEATRDDRAAPEPGDTGAAPSAVDADAKEEWLRANIPPHHGS